MQVFWVDAESFRVETEAFKVKAEAMEAEAFYFHRKRKRLKFDRFQGPGKFAMYSY